MSKQKILVSDDEFVMREGVKETLLDMGFAVDIAKNGVEAMDLLDKKRYTMVITDMKMPGAGGMEVLRKARCVAPDLPVLMMTAYGTVDTAVEAMKVGAFDYILKPFSSEAIEHAVSCAVGKASGGTASGGVVNDKGREIITGNARMEKLLEISDKVAGSDATVLILGESGTGKEILARYIHLNSPRKNGPFVAVNCAALPENLLESELFGHEKGAFTGALTKRPGKFELADGGTLLLDEISEMNLTLQAKLLRVLQERVVDRVGGTKPVPVNIRVLATTNRDMKEMVQNGRFREDLYYRINVFPLTVPALRERVEDIGPLTRFFMNRYGSKDSSITPAAIKSLERSPWKGNVRELENIVQRALLLAGTEPINESHLFFNEDVGDVAQKVPDASAGVKVGMSVREVEKELILKTLDEYSGNRTKAAEVLGITSRTLRNKLKEYRICEEG